MSDLNNTASAAEFNSADTFWIPADATDPIRIEESAEAEIAENDSLGEKIISMFKKNKVALASAIIIVLYIFMAIFAPLVAPYDPNMVDTDACLQNPTMQHLLGTDEFGRDILSRLIYGSRVSLVVGLLPTTISMVIGTVMGLLAGFIGGKVDFIIMRIADVLLAFPSLLLAMLVAYTIGTGMLTIFLALAVVGWAGTARIVRSQTLSLREKEYVEAATSLGVKRSTIIFRHILPNCLPSLIVLFTTNVPGNILSESSLSFLGCGAQPPSTSWGLMIYRNKKYLSATPVATLCPGVMIMILVLAFNFLGDALRDIIDPYMKD